MNLCIIQARLGSTRLPGKVLKKINHKFLLEILLERISKSKTLHKIIVATSTEKTDDAIENFCKDKNQPFFRGGEKDVLDRFYQSIKHFNLNPDSIVRVTADCPLHHFEVIDFCVNEFQKLKVDYFSNSNQPPVLEDGCDTEVFTFSALETAWRNAKRNSDREHITPYMKNSGKFKCEFKKFSIDYHYKLSVDNENDFKLVTEIFTHFHPNEMFSINEVVKFLKANPEIAGINKTSVINEGYENSLQKDSD